MDVSDLQKLRDELKTAIYSGALEVRFGERWIKYQSTSDMRAALTALDAEIAAQTGGGSAAPMCNYGQFNG